MRETYPQFLGNLRRHFFTFASNAVSQRRRSAQALLTLASPSTQVAQSRSCSPFYEYLVTYYSVYHRSYQLYTTMFRGLSRLPGPKQDPPKIHRLIARHILLAIRVALALSKENMPSPPSQTFALSYLFYQALLKHFPSKFACTLQFSIILIIKRVQLQFYTVVNANSYILINGVFLCSRLILEHRALRDTRGGLCL